MEANVSQLPWDQNTPTLAVTPAADTSRTFELDSQRGYAELAGSEPGNISRTKSGRWSTHAELDEDEETSRMAASGDTVVEKRRILENIMNDSEETDLHAEDAAVMRAMELSQ